MSLILVSYVVLRGMCFSVDYEAMVVLEISAGSLFLIVLFCFFFHVQSLH